MKIHKINLNNNVSLSKPGHAKTWQKNHKIQTELNRSLTHKRKSN